MVLFHCPGGVVLDSGVALAQNRGLDLTEAILLGREQRREEA